MKLKRQYINGMGMGVALAATLASCASEPDLPIGDDGSTPAVLAFGGMMSHDEASTRSDSPFQDSYRRFAVWGWKTLGADAQEVMNHEDFTPYEVIYADSRWQYDFNTNIGATSYEQWLKYWDLAAGRYDFVAYAPFRIPDTDAGAETIGSVAFDRTTHTFSIAGMRGNIPLSTDGYVQWLLAHTRRDMNAAAPKDYDMMRSASAPVSDATLRQTSKVPLVFHYLQPIIEIHAYTTCGEDVTATDIVMSLSNDDGTEERTVPTRGSYALGPDGVTPTWTFSTDQADRASKLLDIHENTVIKNIEEEDLPNRREKSTLLAELYEMPVDVSSYFAKIGVRVADDDNVYAGIKTMGEGWTAVQRYIYYIIINPTGGENEYIVMDVSVEAIPWEKGEDIVIDEPLTNW